MDATTLLKAYFEKTLLIELSAKTINSNWGENLRKSISNHVFTDPFRVDEQTDEKQVRHYNKIMGTKWETIKWRCVKSSGSRLFIDEMNRSEFVENALSQIYLQLSVLIFENLIALLSNFITNSPKSSARIINDFYKEFKKELKELDEKNISYNHPTILVLHNLRIFRNCITHENGTLSAIEREFDAFNTNSNNEVTRQEILFEVGKLLKIKFCYNFNTDRSKILLDKQSFAELSDLYSQIAYVSYLCYCKKYDEDAKL